jgi:hypothetical protein
MSKVIKFIGSAIVAAFLFLIPMTTACAFCLSWNGFWKMFFLVFCFVEYFFVVNFVFQTAELEE